MAETLRRAGHAGAAIFLLAALCAGRADAEGGPADVTDPQIEHYKLKLNQDCRDEGEDSGDTEADIDEYCGCMKDLLAKKVSHAEWQRAAYFSRTGNKTEEDKVTDPYVQAVLDACTGKLAALPRGAGDQIFTSR